MSLDEGLKPLPKVPLHSFVHLFNGAAATLRSVPRSLGHSEWEARMSDLGQAVGRRALTLTDATTPRMQSPDEAGIFVANILWKQWFGAPAKDHFAGQDGGSYHLNEDLAFLWQRPDPDPRKEAHEQLHLGAFVAGMIKGALDACGFLCDVSATYVEPASPTAASTQYSIHWAPSVLRRHGRKT